MAASGDAGPGGDSQHASTAAGEVQGGLGSFLTAEVMGELLRAHEERLLLRIGELLWCPGRGGEEAAPGREAPSEPRFASDSPMFKRVPVSPMTGPLAAWVSSKNSVSTGKYRRSSSTPRFARSRAPPVLKSIELARAQELFQGKRFSFSADHMSLSCCTNVCRGSRTSEKKGTVGRCKTLPLSHVNAALEQEDEEAEASSGDPAENHNPAITDAHALEWPNMTPGTHPPDGRSEEPSDADDTRLASTRGFTMLRLKSCSRSRTDSNEEMPQESLRGLKVHEGEDGVPDAGVLSPLEVQLRRGMQSIVPSSPKPVPTSVSCPGGSLASLHKAGEEDTQLPRAPRKNSARSVSALQLDQEEGGASGIPRQKSTAGIAAAAAVQRFKQCSQGFTHKGVDDVQHLRLARESDLIMELSSIESASTRSSWNCEELPQGAVSHSKDSRFLHAEAKVASPLLMRLWGVLPWDAASYPRPEDSPKCSASQTRSRCWLSALYQHLVLVLAVANVCIRARLVAMSEVWSEERPGTVCTCFNHLADIFLALGSMAGLMVLRKLSAGNNLLGSTESVLVGYARRKHLVQPWCQVSTRQCALLLVSWLLAVCTRVVHSTHAPDTGFQFPFHGSCVLTLVSFTFSSGLFTVLTYSLLHIIGLLTMMVDSFCYHFVEEPDLEDGVHNWNILQAVLRRASGAVELGFLFLQTAMLMTVLLGITGLALNEDEPWVHMWYLIAVFPLAMMSARLFFKASGVTEKCTRVPSLINSLSFGGAEVDQRRHYLVQYINYSAAGFYVKDVRLTSAMAIKLVYVSGIVAFGVLTKVASAG